MNRSGQSLDKVKGDKGAFTTNRVAAMRRVISCTHHEILEPTREDPWKVTIGCGTELAKRRPAARRMSRLCQQLNQRQLRGRAAVQYAQAPFPIPEGPESIHQ